MARRAWQLGVAALAIAAVVALAAAAYVARRPVAEAPVRDRDVLYFVLVDRFADGTPDPAGSVDRTDPQAWHGGDLAGILDQVDYLDGLGVGAVWLSPITRARTAPHGAWGAYHGYWVEDLGAVEPRFGTLDALKALSKALHARGIRLYLDMVYNHVGPDAPLLRDHPEWFHGRGDVLDWDDPEQVVYNDVHGLPDLAQERPDVYAYLRDASLRWIDAVDADGFRVDAVRHLAPGFLAKLGAELRAHRPGFELLGEVYDGSVDRVAERAREDHLDAVFDFPLRFAIRDAVCGSAPFGKVAALVNADYGGATPVTLVDNHDLPRILSECDDDADLAAVALAVLMSARGTPSLTWGTEIGLSGAAEPANRADMVFPAPGDPVAPIGETVRALIALRRAWAPLRAPESRVVGLDADGAVIARLAGDEAVVVTLGHPGRGGPRPRWRALRGPPLDSRVVVGAGPIAAVAPEGHDHRDQVQLERYASPEGVRATGPVRLSVVLERPPVLVEGDRIVLCGAGDALGRWDAAEGVPLDADGAFHLRVNDGDVLAYKPVIVRPDGTVAWEPHPDRFLLVTSERWTGTTPCGAWCAPVGDDGAAVARLWWGDAELLDAAAAGDGDAVAEALALGADPGAVDAEGRVAIQAAVDSGDDRAVEALLRAGATAPDLLLRAVRVPNDRLLALLLARGGPVDVPSAAGVTPLMRAVELGNVGAIRRLRAVGADPDRVDAEGRSAVDRAVTPELRELLGVL